MKFLILISCAVAATSAAYYGPQHIPVIGPNGVPVEPHEVQAARASHLAAVASAHGATGASPYYPTAYSAPFTAYGVPTLGHNALVSAPLLAGPYPVDTPEVQIAKAAHFQAHAEAAAKAGAGSYLGHYRSRRDVYGGYHIPVIGANGVPVETPEVQAAKANHLAALAEASSRAGPYDYSGDDSGAYSDAYASAPYAEPYRRYYGPQATIGPDGHPVETPEVKAAKAYHFAAYSAARSGGHIAGPGHYY